MSYIVASFYKFVSLQDCQQQQAQLLSYCQQQNLKGTIILAPEGINGTLAGSREGIKAILAFLRSDSRFSGLEVKESLSEHCPFKRMKIKLKREIVTFGNPDANPSTQVGTYVRPQDWNRLIEDPDVVVIDTRNRYEVAIGSFKGAKNPQTDSFVQFPDYVSQNFDPQQHPKVAMFCTGGIRCEKASSYLLSQGFKEVYHLEGGILKYLAEITPEESLWEGECFVFDERVAVKHGLAQGSYDLCLGCGYPISDSDKASPHYQKGVCCPHCHEINGKS